MVARCIGSVYTHLVRSAACLGMLRPRWLRGLCESAGDNDMKKIYQGGRWQRYSRRRAWREQRRRSARAAAADSGTLETIRSARRRLPTPIHKLPSPSNFSLVHNTVQMLTFFDRIRHWVRKGHRIKVSMAGVTNMTPDAILYLLSILYDCTNKYPELLRISGDVPRDPYCRTLFAASGFQGFVRAKGVWRGSDAAVFKVAHGGKAQGPVADELLCFAEARLGKTPGTAPWDMYSTIVEAMVNTRQHAYSGAPDGLPHWWLMASHDTRNGRVDFAILDNGAGIPATIRKKVIEFVKQGVYTLTGRSQDSELILAALKGEGLRSRTGQAYRGKGLPKMTEYCDRGCIRDLGVIAGRGHVQWGTKSKSTELPQRFRGTLLSWSFV